MIVHLRPTHAADLAFVTALERDAANRNLIGQWADEEHLAAIEGRDRREHWIIERGGEPAGYLIAYDARHERAGIYVKRILVGDKERGTGSEALRQFIRAVREREGVDCVWLIVRADNARAQQVYRKLGFERFYPEGEEAWRYDAGGEEPMTGAIRMRLSVPAGAARSD